MSERFEVVGEISRDALLDQMRLTTLLGQPDTLVYADSTITLEPIEIRRFRDPEGDSPWWTTRDLVAPTTKYVVADHLALQDELRDDLLGQIRRDQTHLQGAVLLYDNHTKEHHTLIPPIVERSEEDGFYVLDGAHRVVSALNRWRQDPGGHRYDTRLSVSHDELVRKNAYDAYNANPYRESRDHYETVREASRIITAIVIDDPAFPAYAVPNMWRDIKVVTEVPTDPTQKKNYRTDWPKEYKALYRTFLGSAGLRGI
jgi:hypothetical protein